MGAAPRYARSSALQQTRAIGSSSTGSSSCLRAAASGGGGGAKVAAGPPACCRRPDRVCRVFAGREAHGMRVEWGDGFGAKGDVRGGASAWGRIAPSVMGACGAGARVVRFGIPARAACKGGGKLVPFRTGCKTRSKYRQIMQSGAAGQRACRTRARRGQARPVDAANRSLPQSAGPRGT